MENYDRTIIPLDKKIGVLCGGLSSEREVSLRSGKNCYEALLRLGYKKIAKSKLCDFFIGNLQRRIVYLLSLLLFCLLGLRLLHLL